MYNRSRAFTLLDFAGVMAGLLLALVVILPSLSTNRAASQGDASRNNLKQLIKAHAAYTLAHQGRWMNPFDPTTTFNGMPNAVNPEWYSVQTPGMPGYVWRLNDAGHQTEMFSMFWASVARPGPMGDNLLSPVQFDPRDQRFINRLGTLASSGTNLNSWLWPTSYLYSPTMWFNPARYAGEARLAPAAPNQLGGVRSVRHNTTADVLYPSLKVVLFQRFDFDQSSRAGPSGPVALPPQWNNTAATPDAAFADGSVDEVSIKKQLSAISGSPVTAQWLRPTTPTWNLSSTLLNDPSVGYELGSEWENGQNNTTAWSAFFWGTRGGISGRDVYRR